jgi:hypothetical protein
MAVTSIREPLQAEGALIVAPGRLLVQATHLPAIPDREILQEQVRL